MRAASESMPCAAPLAFTPTAGSETTVGEDDSGAVVRLLDDDGDVANVADAPHLRVGQDRRIWPRRSERGAAVGLGDFVELLVRVDGEESVEVDLRALGHAADLLDQMGQATAPPQRGTAPAPA